MSKLNRVLVTGAAGFIGSNLCESLCQLGYNVTGLDNFATGNKKNVKRLSGYNNYKFYQSDIREYSDCLKLTKNIDVVFHQAALGSVPRSLQDPMTTNNVNVGGFVNMLHASVQNGVKRFVYAASSSTYGDSEKLPKLEDNIGKPLSPYAITKYVNELYADVFNKNHGIDTIGLRYFNVFGQFQDPNGAYAAVIPKFIKQFMNNKPVTINGDGSYSRDFTYIDNVIQANILSLETTNPLALNQIYNVAYGGRTTIAELAHSIKTQLSILDSSIDQIPILYGSVRDGDVPHSMASIEKAKNLLGYNPQFDLTAGLEQSVRWYWENL